jgi:hypothetical protein
LLTCYQWPAKIVSLVASEEYIPLAASLGKIYLVCINCAKTKLLSQDGVAESKYEFTIHIKSG